MSQLAYMEKDLLPKVHFSEYIRTENKPDEETKPEESPKPQQPDAE